MYYDSQYDNNSDDDTFHDAVQGMQQIDDQVYYDSNSNDGNENDDDTFHDSIQAEDMIDDTYNDNDDVNRKPINNMIDHGEQRLTLYIINYGVSDSSIGNGCSDDYDDWYVDITSANEVECLE